MRHRFRFSTSGNPTKHMPIGYLSLRVQPRSVTSGDLSWPWISSGAMSRVTSSHVLTWISSTIPIPVNRTTPSCAYSRFRWNLVESCSSYDVITSWPDLTRPNFFFHQKLRKRCSISYWKFQRDSPNGVAFSSEKLMGGCMNPPDRASVNPRPDGPLDIPPSDGGGGVFEHPPSISAPAHRRIKRKTAFESSRKIISKTFRSFFWLRSKLRSPGVKIPKFSKTVFGR